jgi:hypothetical protein
MLTLCALMSTLPKGIFKDPHTPPPPPPWPHYCIAFLKEGSRDERRAQKGGHSFIAQKYFQPHLARSHLSRDYLTRYQETSNYLVVITHALWTKAF